MKWADALVLRELEKGDPLLNAHDESHILAAACLAAARRNIHEATPALERLLGSAHPAPRAAAAAALLSLGWGIGMGHVSSGAAKVLGIDAGRPFTSLQGSKFETALDASYTHPGCLSTSCVGCCGTSCLGRGYTDKATRAPPWPPRSD